MPMIPIRFGIIRIYWGPMELPSTINVTGPTTISPTFNDANEFPGISGDMNYTGAGLVNSQNPINVIAYADSKLQHSGRTEFLRHGQ